MISDKALKKFMDHRRDRPGRIQQELELALNKLQTRRAIDDDLRAVLRRLAPEVSDAFIWCVATCSGFKDIAAQFEARARRQLQTQEYRTVYARVFPEVLC